MSRTRGTEYILWTFFVRTMPPITHYQPCTVPFGPQGSVGASVSDTSRRANSTPTRDHAKFEISHRRISYGEMRQILAPLPTSSSRRCNFTPNYPSRRRMCTPRTNVRAGTACGETTKLRAISKRPKGVLGAQVLELSSVGRLHACAGKGRGLGRSFVWGVLAYLTGLGLLCATAGNVTWLS